MKYGTSALRPVSRRSRRCVSRLFTARPRRIVANLGDVLVAAAREVEQDRRARGIGLPGLLHDPRHGVRGLERGDDAFELAQRVCSATMTSSSPMA